MNHPIDINDSSGVHSFPYYTGPERRSRPRVGEPSGWLATLMRRIWALVAYSDTTPTRFTLATAASFWAFMLLFPGDSMSRPAFRYLSESLGSYADEKLGGAWGVLAIGMWWRLLSGSPRPRAALAINIYGAMLFSTMPVAVILDHIYPAPAGLAPAFALACASYWVAVRTNIYSAKGWRSD